MKSARGGIIPGLFVIEFYHNYQPVISFTCHVIHLFFKDIIAVHNVPWFNRE